MVCFSGGQVIRWVNRVWWVKWLVAKVVKWLSVSEFLGWLRG